MQSFLCRLFIFHICIEITSNINYLKLASKLSNKKLWHLPAGYLKDENRNGLMNGMSDSPKGFLPPPQFPEIDQSPRKRWFDDRTCRNVIAPLFPFVDSHLHCLTLTMAFEKIFRICSCWKNSIWSCALWGCHFLIFVLQLLKNADSCAGDQGACVEKTIDIAWQLEKQLIELKEKRQLQLRTWRKAIDGSTETREAMTKPQVLSSVTVILLQSYCTQKHFMIKYFLLYLVFIVFGCITLLSGMKDT